MWPGKGEGVKVVQARSGGKFARSTTYERLKPASTATLELARRIESTRAGSMVVTAHACPRPRQPSISPESHPGPRAQAACAAAHVVPPALVWAPPRPIVPCWSRQGLRLPPPRPPCLRICVFASAPLVATRRSEPLRLRSAHRPILLPLAVHHRCTSAAAGHAVVARPPSFCFYSLLVTAVKPRGPSVHQARPLRPRRLHSCAIQQSTARLTSKCARVRRRSC